MKILVKHVLCIWNPQKKKWTVDITLSDGARRIVEYTRSRSRRTSVKKIVDNVLKSEGLNAAWDMRYGWKTIDSREVGE